MEKSIFFNSAPGDPRKYQASDFAGYFGTVLSSGLFHTDNLPALEVHCNGSDMRTYVNAGKATIDGYFYENTSDLYLTHALPEASLSRIDRIVLRLDKRNQSRFIKLFVVQGVSSATPVAPSLQRDDFIYELGLAEIKVRANTSTLVPSDLVDTRLNQSLCGLAHSLISIPTSQFQAQWDAFMKDIQDDGFVTHDTFNTHKSDSSHVPHLGTTTNAGNVYNINTSETISMNRKFTIVFNAASTGAPTLKINNGAPFAIKKPGGASATLKIGAYTLFYDSVAFHLLGEGGDYGTAVAGDVRVGKTVGTDNGLVTGNIPVKNASNGNGSLAPAHHVASEFSPSSGHLFTRPNGIGGTGTVIYEGDVWIDAVDADFISSNFRADKNIFGMQGSIPINTDSVANSTAGSSAGRIYVRPKAGYWDGSQGSYVDDANLVPANVRTGVSLFGGAVIGTLVPMPPYTPGNSWVTAGYTGDFTSLNAWAFAKCGITPSVGGTYRVSWGLNTAFTYGMAYARTYVNSVPVGPIRSKDSTATALTYVEDIAVNAGDEIQIWGYVDSSAISGLIFDFKLGISVVFPHTHR